METTSSSSLPDPPRIPAPQLASPAGAGPPGFLRTYVRQLRRDFVTGLFVWVPLFTTIWVVLWVMTKISTTIESLMGSLEAYTHKLVERFPSLALLDAFEYNIFMGVLLMILIFLTTGFFTRYIIGRKIIAAGERLVARIPLINMVYTSVQQIRDVFMNRDGAVIQQVVLIEYPRKGMWCVGFVMSDEGGIVQEAIGTDLVAVFVPTTPNPTSGFLLYVVREEVIRLDMSVEEAMKLIVSGGAYSPGKKTRTPAAT
ncbi:MAG: DUF502 domain-containing protein [Candidatus Hydrogenedentes bacterium]|nr:DUF502 domain-containing protein [Candidatus Hydrogenedentota bacterium]